MKLTVTLPTRGRPALLAQALAALTANTEDKTNTVVVVASDDDDSTISQLHSKMNNVTIYHTVAPREDTLGAKYNRAALVAFAPADAYIQHADDQVIETPGWDARVREALQAFDDARLSATAPGLLYFGLGAGTMPANMVVNEAMRRSLGYMFPPYFPQWWHETWLDEVGWLSGRILWVPEIACRGIAPENGGRGRTKSLRDLAFWADFFQRTRPLRVAQAQAILDAGPDPAYRLAQLGHQATQLYGWFRDREAQFANPANNEGIMKMMAEPLEPGEAERLDRARAAAEALLKEKGL